MTTASIVLGVHRACRSWKEKVMSWKYCKWFCVCSGSYLQELSGVCSNSLCLKCMWFKVWGTSTTYIFTLLRNWNYRACSFYFWQKVSGTCDQSWPILLWAWCWTRWPAEVLSSWCGSMVLPLLSSTSSLKEVFKLWIGFVDIVNRGEFPCLRTFGTTEVVVGHPLTKSRLRWLRPGSLPSY